MRKPNKAELAVQNEELLRENAALRKALEIDGAMNVYTWAQHAPQELRDQIAASALIAEKLDEPRALKRLGFTLLWKPNPGTKELTRLDPVVWTWCEQIFGTPGVKAILARDMEDANANKQKIIARLIQTATHGDDGDSVRAAQQIARMADWNEGDKSAARAGAPVLNLLQMFGEARKSQSAALAEANPDAIISAAEFHVHEPTKEGSTILDEDTVALGQ